MNDPVHTVICFDYGKKYIGVAVGQKLTYTATALETIRAFNGEANWESVDRILREWQAEILVVGLPLRMDGTPQQLSRAAKRFARQLYLRYDIPVYMMDERLSSVEAERLVAMESKVTKFNKKDIDKMAAKLILQSWLEQNK